MAGYCFYVQFVGDGGNFIRYVNSQSWSHVERSWNKSGKQGCDAIIDDSSRKEEFRGIVDQYGHKVVEEVSV